MMKSVKLRAGEALLALSGLFMQGAGGGVTTAPRLDVPLQSPSVLKSAWDRALAVPDDGALPCPVRVQSASDVALPPIVVIDLGHGFQPANGAVDPGTVNRAAHLREIDIIDAVGRELRDELRARGYDAVTTREPGEPLPFARGDYRQSLSIRGHMPALLSASTGRRVVLLSLHVDNGRAGSEVYVENSERGRASLESRRLADVVAKAFGASAWRGRFENRMLRRFGEASRACVGVRGGAALVELGNIRDPRDIVRFRAWLHDARPAAARLADGLAGFLNGDAVGPAPLLEAANAPASGHGSHARAVKRARHV